MASITVNCAECGVQQRIRLRTIIVLNKRGKLLGFESDLLGEKKTMDVIQSEMHNYKRNLVPIDCGRRLAHSKKNKSP